MAINARRMNLSDKSKAIQGIREGDNTSEIVANFRRSRLIEINGDSEGMTDGSIASDRRLKP
jgi:hypothetical protein